MLAFRDRRDRRRPRSSRRPTPIGRFRFDQPAAGAAPAAGRGGRVPGGRERRRSRRPRTASPSRSTAKGARSSGACSAAGAAGRGRARAAGAGCGRPDPRDHDARGRRASRSAGSAPGATRCALRPPSSRRRSCAAIEAGDGPGAAADPAGAWSPGQAIAGRVVDDAGAALAGVPVRIEAGGGAPGEDPLPTLVSVGRGGRLRRARGPRALPADGVAAGLRAAARAQSVDDKTPAARRPGRASSWCAARASSGSVLDGRGGPAAGAARSLRRERDRGPHRADRSAAARRRGGGAAVGRGARARQHARRRRRPGRALRRRRSRSPGRYRFEIAHPGSEPLRSDEFVLAPGERRDAGKLALRLGFPVVGRVTDESGAPIEGARAVVASAARVAGVDGSVRAHGRRRAVRAGAARGRLPAGEQRRRARRDAGLGRRGRRGRAPPPLEVKLIRAEAALEGMVRDDGGRPLARARLSVWPAGARSSCRRRPARPRAAGQRRRRRGRALHGSAQLPAGDLRLEVQHPDYPTSVHATTAGKYAMLTVPFPGGDRGRGAGEGDRRRGRARPSGRGGPGRREGDDGDPQGRHVSPAAAGSGPLAADHGGGRLPQRRAGAGRAGQLRSWAKRLSASCASSSTAS